MSVAVAAVRQKLAVLLQRNRTNSETTRLHGAATCVWLASARMRELVRENGVGSSVRCVKCLCFERWLANWGGFSGLEAAVRIWRYGPDRGFYN